MTEKMTTGNRTFLGIGGVAALALVILGIFNKPAYSSLVAAAVMWSLASLAMIALGVAFIRIRSVFETPVVYAAAAVLFLKAVLVVIPLFIVCKEEEMFLSALAGVRNGVDILFLALTAWIAYCGRPMLGGPVSRLIAALLTVAALCLFASHIVIWLSGRAYRYLSWVIIVSTLLGIGGLGAGFIWLAVRRGTEGGSGDAA
jgi:hypothetical protein